MDATTLSLARLSDQELLKRVAELAAAEREATALLIAHLAELDTRRLHLAEGFSSLFAYCTDALQLSEYSAYNRIEAARASRKFPVIVKWLFEGSLTLTTVRLLAPYLTTEKDGQLLERARFKSKRAVEELIAEMYPRAAVASLLRRLPVPRTGSEPSPGNGSTEEAMHGNRPPVANPPVPASPQPHPHPATVAPLAPQRYKVRFTASTETVEKLRLAQDLLRHQIPDGDLDKIISRALTALLDNVARKKVAATTCPRPGGTTGSESRHIPAAVRRIVWLRDGGRCAFVSKSGRRCRDAGFLEFHHVIPYAEGGDATVDNIQLRCRAHNAFEGELHFGPRLAAGTSVPP